MSNLNAVGPRPIQSTVLPAAAQAGGTAAGVQAASASGNLAPRIPVVEAVAPAADSVSISRQALEARATALGNRTVDLAQEFVSDFAKKLFGAAADGASVSFDSATLASSEQVSAQGQHSAAQGATATLDLSESAHFLGKGQITTSDGQRFQFEIEVAYQADVHASASQSVQLVPALPAPDALALTGAQLPAIEFPGSLDDLFSLLGRALQLSAPSNPGRADQGEHGNLTLRLQRLVNSAALLAPRAPSGEPVTRPADRSRAVADSYGSAPTSAEVAAA